MNEFDKCNFCLYQYGIGICSNEYCVDHSDYSLNVNKILEKADERNISITDVINLIKECNK